MSECSEATNQGFETREGVTVSGEEEVVGQEFVLLQKKKKRVLLSKKENNSKQRKDLEELEVATESKAVENGGHRFWELAAQLCARKETVQNIIFNKFKKRWLDSTAGRGGGCYLGRHGGE